MCWLKKSPFRRGYIDICRCLMANANIFFKIELIKFFRLHFPRGGPPPPLISASATLWIVEAQLLYAQKRPPLRLSRGTRADFELGTSAENYWGRRVWPPRCGRQRSVSGSPGSVVDIREAALLDLVRSASDCTRGRFAFGHVSRASSEFSPPDFERESV